jgi:hypothetical protein
MISQSQMVSQSTVDPLTILRQIGRKLRRKEEEAPGARRNASCQLLGHLRINHT